ncbi:MAG: hypothetical protein GY727_14075 [Gammaproteobacteria bacterium]|nr:hypothetical protein [Gammaproteobacteria bacterium]MCP4091088.1 hypothetical protein [Gammaproteobacteria bacterium]MCP4277386.1 hypothetical protein [Gammaproteobacteria bacterium]MCP4831553.1 hypothetical protein [Gammaproteobacteria bacterium]MCP4927776.1 hypothetical protein [Gammaproteobacteria bacterium]
MNEDEIPVLRNAVARKVEETLSQEQVDELCDSLNAETSALIDELLVEALQKTEEALRFKINDRLSNELPVLIEKTLRKKFTPNSDN